MEEIWIGVLFYPALADFKCRHFYIEPVIGMSIVVLALQFLQGDFGWRQCLGVIPGLLCLILSKVTREAIGFGDGIVLVCVGMLLGAQRVIVILSGAFLINGILALGLLVSGHANGKTTLPFIPFLLIAAVIAVAGGMI